jgi:hypothetical protein
MGCISVFPQPGLMSRLSSFVFVPVAGEDAAVAASRPAVKAAAFVYGLFQARMHGRIRRELFNLPTLLTIKSGTVIFIEKKRR